jgi:hypothetical protein
MKHKILSHWIVARSSNQHHQIQLATHYLPHIKLPKTPNHYTFTLKMVTAMFGETLDNSQHSTQLIPERRTYTLNTSRENLITIIVQGDRSHATHIKIFIDGYNTIQLDWINKHTRMSLSQVQRVFIVENYRAPRSS